MADNIFRFDQTRDADVHLADASHFSKIVIAV